MATSEPASASGRNVLVNENTLKAIANSIRAKNGQTTTYKPAEMAPAIDAIQTGDLISHEDIPSYVKGEALRVAKLVKAKQDEITASGGTPFTMLCMSDAHDAPTTSNVSNASAITNGNIHAGMAAKVIAYACKLDACAFLGDYAWGYDKTSTDDNIADIDSVTKNINEAFNGIPQFRTVGNHDSGDYEGDTYLTPAQLYAKIGKYNADGTTVMGSTTGGWCYRDFATQKVRVVCLNTADNSTNAVSNEQAKWFAQTLNATPSGYYVIILSHHPADYGGNAIIANTIYAAYTKGSINAGGTTVSFSDFAGNIACQFHGHVHCYLADKINHIENSVGTPFDVKRIATPNMCYARNNEYGTTASYFGIVFGETATYAKTADSATDTAFVVNVFDPKSFIVHSYHYGAGTDRSVYLGAESVAVTGVKFAQTSGELTRGNSMTLTPVFTPSNATDQTGTWSTSDASIATVSDGAVKGVGNGTATITFTSSDGGYNATYSVTVKVATTTVAMTHDTRLSTSSGSEKASTGYSTTAAIDVSNTNHPNGVTITIANASDVVGNSSPYTDSAIVRYLNGAFNSSTYICNGNVSPLTWEKHITMTRTDDRTGATIVVDNEYGEGATVKLCVKDTNQTATCIVVDN